ncbi:MAG TPA: uracil-DNA glycosylase [Thermomicrobiales bacterium]|nr:uracil-DNA glycosylase [Thermomicrobiales bacterium]
MTRTTADAALDALCERARACRACRSMDGRLRILSRLNGPPDARVMLVGEAPGRLGAARTAVPFAGDESGRRLDQLIAAAGWRRDELFITNAVLCNPLDEAGRNRPPRSGELANCRSWLQAQIDLIDPHLVVALGAVALKSLAGIEPHPLTVRDSANPPIPWHGRHLAAAYHPSARAAIHRPFAVQLDDFRRLGQWSRETGLKD